MGVSKNNSHASHASPARARWGSLEEELAYYKAQYETLEVELQEFQSSSKELEAELERDVEESEKRDRKLQEKAEKLGFEVEEWKVRGSFRHNKAHVHHLRAMANNVIDKVQAEQDRGEQRAKHAAKGNHRPARKPTRSADATARYRSPKRRF